MEKIINTPCGQIKGTAGRQAGVTAYKGIRYATAGRWEYPQIVKSWEGIYDATQYGNCSFQPRSFYNEAEMPEKAFYYNEFRKGEQYTYSEDCLFLNVFTPENAKEGDIVINVTKSKKLTNMRSKSADDKAVLPPPIRMSLEEALEYIKEDEYVEVTPHAMRIRKIILDELERKRAGR